MDLWFQLYTDLGDKIFLYSYFELQRNYLAEGWQQGLALYFFIASLLSMVSCIHGEPRNVSPVDTGACSIPFYGVTLTYTCSILGIAFLQHQVYVHCQTRGLVMVHVGSSSLPQHAPVSCFGLPVELHWYPNDA